MKITLFGAFVLLALACNFAISSAYPNTPSIDKFDSDMSDLQETDTNPYDYRNSRLRRSYYYDDDYYGSYYPYYSSYSGPSYSSPIRREDTDIDRAYKYTPLVRYKSTRTKRKKLFVPNLWG